MNQRRTWLYGSVAAFVLLPVLAALLLLARLLWGPLSIAMFGERIAVELARAMPGLHLEFEDVRLALDRRRGLFVLDFDGVQLAHDPSGLSGRLRDVRIDLPWRPLLEARIAPREAMLAGIDLDLAYTWPDGTDGARVEFAGIPEIAPPAGLERVTLRDARIALRETRSGELRRLEVPEATLDRRLTANARLLAGDRPAGRLALTLDRKRLEIEVEGLHPGALAAGLPELEGLAGLDVALDGTLAIDLDASGRVGPGRAELRGGAGRLALPGLYPEPRAFDGVALTLAYEPSERSVRLESLTLDFAGQTMALSGAAAWAAQVSEPRLRLAGGFGPLDMAALVAWWPDDAAPGGRSWIAENIEGGWIEDARLMLDLAPGAAPSLAVDFDFRDLVGHYLRPMPPLRGGAGRGRLEATGLLLEFEAGEIEGLPVAGSRVRLTDLDNAVERGEIGLALSGTMPDILRLIDHEPLGFAAAFGIDPGSVTGRAELTAKLALPLLRDLSIGEVEIAVEAAIEGLAIAGLVGEQGLESGDLRLAVDRDGLTAHGMARLAGIDLELDWREEFDPSEGAPSSRYHARGVLNATDLERLGYGAGERFSGRAALDLELVADGREPRGGQLSADLTQAALAVPELGWSKPEGISGTLDFGFDFADGQVRSLTSIAFDSGDDSLRAEILPGRDGGPDEVRLDRLRLGRTELAGSFTRGADGAIFLDLAGPSFDAEPLLARFDTGDVGADDAPEIVRPLEIRLTADRVFGLDGEVFEAVEARARRSDRMWLAMHLDARHADGAKLRFDLAGNAEGGRSVALFAEDSGHALAGLGLFDRIEGGRLDVTAGMIGHGRDVRIDGHAEIRDFRLLPGPRLDAEIDEEASGRLAELVGPDGMNFSEMVLPFSLADGIIDIDDARANGPRLGLTAQGQVDRAMERIDINGVLVPAYWANSLLGRIPLLGELFSGGEGGGLFALSYRISGSTEAPKVSVGALSLLLPGILRRPFERGKGKLEPREPPPDDPDGSS